MLTIDLMPLNPYFHGTTSRIGAGEHWNKKKVPYVGASIIHAAATPDRPWYVQLRVTWPEALPPPYGTMK